MSEKEPSALHLQFGPWLMTQISSGKYPGLEWLDGEKKSVFKIPWTKIYYPMWEEHHRIFKAWAIHRGKSIKDSGELEQSFSQIKSNFRTILRKCVEIEEVEDAHQLGLQMGNYKVYRILSREESIAKRKSQQKTRKYYRWSRNCAAGLRSSSKHPGEMLDDSTQKSAKIAKLEAEIKSKLRPIRPKVEPVNLQNNSTVVKATTNTIATQTCPQDYTDVSFLLEPAAFEEAPGLDIEVSSDVSSGTLQNSVSTQIECPMMLDSIFVGNQVDISEKSAQEVGTSTGSNLDGFQMLLDAAQLAEAPRGTSSGRKHPSDVAVATEPAASKQISPSIVDVLLELKIPPEELFAYDMNVRYETRLVLNNAVLNDMSYGYRIHYGSVKGQRAFISNCQSDNSKLSEDFDRTPITLPESKVPPGNLLYTVLKNTGAGLVIKSDKQYNLHAKRLCSSRVYVFTGYGDKVAETEPMLMTRHLDAILFSYKKFLKDWYQFLIEGSPKPNHEINLAFGKKTKHRHSRAFVSITLVPKAAETMLQRIAENMDESTLDNLLRLFNAGTL